MKVFIIKRVYGGKDGTDGVLIEQGYGPICVTKERRWNNNKKGESCIPTGEFRCKRVSSPKFGNTFEVLVEGRTAILFHKGNIDDDSHGCIIVGEYFDPFKNKDVGVLMSGHAMDEFLARLTGEQEFKLVILEV